MGSKSISQEYEFSDSEDSPVRPFKRITSQIGESDSNEHDHDEKRIKLDKRLTGSTGVDDSDNATDAKENVPTTILESENHDLVTRKQQNEHGAKNIKQVSRTVIFMHSKELVETADQMIKTQQRASLVSSLIEAYGLHKYLSVIEPRPATFDELCAFHSPDYLEFLRDINDQDDEEKYNNEAQHYGLSYDCPAHTGIYDYTCLISGATVQAAEYLMDDMTDVAINWFGGWHHGRKDCAAGFSYSNDVVLGILKLREKFSRILYVDLDLHHGDGVEDAFCSTNKVLTLSVHKQAVGFFPGTGKIKDVGCGKGKHYAVNIPLKDGIQDTEFSALVCRILVKVKEKFNPEVVVCQCGADGLAGDPMESFNLTQLSLGRCVSTLLSWKLPILLLGGGGYNHPNTARCWTYLTGIAVGRKLLNDIPDHKFLMDYGPDYELQVTTGNKKNENSKDYLQNVYRDVLNNINQISTSPC